MIEMVGKKTGRLELQKLPLSWDGNDPLHGWYIINSPKWRPPRTLCDVVNAVQIWLFSLIVQILSATIYNLQWFNRRIVKT